MAAMINSWPLGFYAPAQLVRDAREHGVEVRPVDVNHSDWDCTLEPAAPKAKHPFALRLGLRMIAGLPRATGDALMQARTSPYRTVHELTRRTGLRRTVLERLAKADAFASLGLSRRAALWHVRAEEAGPHDRPLLANLDEQEPDSPLPAMNEREEVFADYRTQGLSLRNHPIAFHRESLDQLKIVTARRLHQMKDGQPARTAGLVLLRQRPSTAKGITFVTLEDETGVVNLVVHQRTWERFYQVARKSNAWIAAGRVQRAGEVVHLVVEHLEDMADRLRGLNTTSRDFR